MGIFTKYLVVREPMGVKLSKKFRKSTHTIKLDLPKKLLHARQNLANYHTYQRLLNRFNFVSSVKQRSTLEGRMFLGTAYADYTGEPYVPHINIVKQEGGVLLTDAVVNLILGGIGSGKSILAGVILFDNGIDHYEFKVPTIIFDFSQTPEWHLRTRPITKQFPRFVRQITEMMAEKGRKPRGYSRMVYGPGFIRDDSSINKRITLVFRDFIDIAAYDPDLASNLMGDLVGLKREGDENSWLYIPAILKNAKEWGIRTFEDVATLFEERADELKALKLPSKCKLPQYVRLAEISGYLGFGSESNLTGFYKDMVDYDYVVMRGQLKKSGGTTTIDKKAGVYTIMIMEKLVRDMTLAFSDQRSDRERSVMKAFHGMQVCLEEADNFVSDEDPSYSKEYFEKAASKFRKIGVNQTYITQNFKRFSKNITSLAANIFMSRVSSDDNARVLEIRDIPATQINKLKHMKKAVRNPIGNKISEWAHINSRNRIRKFFLFFPQFQFKAV